MTGGEEFSAEAGGRGTEPGGSGRAGGRGEGARPRRVMREERAGWGFAPSGSAAVRCGRRPSFSGEAGGGDLPLKNSEQVQRPEGFHIQ